MMDSWGDGLGEGLSGAAFFLAVGYYAVARLRTEHAADMERIRQGDGDIADVSARIAALEAKIKPVKEAE